MGIWDKIAAIDDPERVGDQEIYVVLSIPLAYAWRPVSVDVRHPSEHALNPLALNHRTELRMIL